MSTRANLGRVDRSPRAARRPGISRLLLLLGWLLASIGYWGPWIAHPTAALTLSGVDMGEFVKFLPQVLDGSLHVARQMFYLPAFAVVASIALLLGTRQLDFAWILRLPVLALSIPVSLQILPPAWSPASLATAEFRLQTVGLGICWLLLAGFWLLGRLPFRLVSSLASASALAGAALSAWAFWTVKPAIDRVYGTGALVGWGFFLCMAGLAAIAGTGLTLALQKLARSRGSWRGG